MSELVTQNMQLLASAPSGVKKLRELMLELAVQGKLVPQDSDDEPASELLERIAAEKARLVEEGAIKPPKQLAQLAVKERPFALPKGWVWSSLTEVALINPRNSVQDTLPVSFVPMSLIGTNFDGLHAQEQRIWGEVKKGFTHFAEGDVGVAKITPCFENSKACVFSGLTNGIGAGTTELHVVRLVADAIDARYVLAYVKSPGFLLVGEIGMTGTAGQKRLPKDFIERNPFPLPPLAEQQRIVAKLDELMALCDRLEAQQADAESAHGQLVEALLGSLTQARDADDFAASWQRLSAHFHTLFTTESSIDALKQALLHLAVMGKLVPQNAGDESAGELLEQIATYKSRLLVEGRIRMKYLPEIISDEAHAALPSGWRMARLADLVNVLNGRAYKKDELLDSSTGTPVLRVGNLFTSKHWYYSDIELEDDKYCSEGDLIFAWSASFGPFIWSGPRAIYHYHIWKLDFFGSPRISKPYLYNVLLEQTQKIKAAGHGVAMTHMTKEKMEKLPVPVPPLAEQVRIVAALDQLMSLCNHLKSRLKQARKLNERLASALVERAVA